MIITFQQFWKDFDRSAGELNTSVVSVSEDGDAVCSYVYFDGLKGDAGVCRVYAKIISPKNGSEKAIIVLNDINKSVDDFDYSAFLSMGFTVIIMDYGGKNDDFVRSTIYPKCFEFANYSLNKNCIFTLPENLHKSCRYVWTALLLRCITFAESEGYSQLGLLGIGEGGSEVIKAMALVPSLKCGAILFSHSRVSEKDEKDYDSELLAYSAALGVVNYAPFLKSPLFMQLTSNEKGLSLDKMVKIYSACAENTAILALSERSERIINKNQENNIYLFFDKVFNDQELQKPPKISAKNSSNNLYINITPESASEIEDISLFAAHAQKISEYRNWRKIPLEKTGMSEYLAKIPVYSANDFVFAFANVKYANGFCISSSVISVLPSSLKITPVSFVPKRLIYDVEDGLGDWIVTGKEQFAPLCIEKGPFDIEGICAPMGKIATFALADKIFTPFEGASLQLSIYSYYNQDITFSLKNLDSDSLYSHTLSFNPLDNWTKINLSVSDFKSGSGTLKSWENIVNFEITAKDKFLINTMLWI